MRAARFAALSALCAGIAVAQMPVSTCDDEYECIYQASTVDNITFSFDLRPLCETGQTYTATDSTGHTYSFNICGTSSFQCIPQWQNIYQVPARGVVCFVLVFSSFLCKSSYLPLCASGGMFLLS